MNFSGTHFHSVDDKGRFIMPSKFRADLGSEKYVITKGIENCLHVLSTDAWDEKVEKLNRLSNNKKEVRNIKRHILGSAEVCGFDGQGRSVIPSLLRDYAFVKTGILVIGVGDKIEIWDKEYYETYIEKENITQKSIEESVENLEGFEV